MNPKDMLKTPVERRRGAVTQETGSWGYLLVQDSPEAILDAMLRDKTIGAARCDCLADVRAGNVPRPIGPWGMLVRLKGQPWTYVLGDGLRFEWPQQWAARHSWRVAWFSLDGMINTKVARLFDGKREIFNFVCGLIEKAEAGFAFRKKIDIESAMIRGAADVCNEAWLKQLKSGGEAMDLLARLAEAYLPVALYRNDKEGKVGVSGWDGDPHPDDDEEYENFPDDAFERVDVFTFGGAETLEPNAASIALGKAVRAGDAAAAKKALDCGADPNVMPDDNESPLIVALGLGSPFLEGGRFAKVSFEKQLALMKVLLEAGANPDPPGRDPAIHRAIHWAGAGANTRDERTIVDQLRLLLDHKADPNAMGTELRGAGDRPLHVVAFFHQWMAVLKLLVSRGADATLKNHIGRTAREHAQVRMEYLQKSMEQMSTLQKASSDKERSSTPGSLSDFAAALTSPKAMGKDLIRSMLSTVSSMQDNQSRDEIERLHAVMEFLKEAEQGKADVNGIDEIADDASEQNDEQKNRDEKEKEAALETLLGGILNLTEGEKKKRRK